MPQLRRQGSAELGAVDEWGVRCPRPSHSGIGSGRRLSGKPVPARIKDQWCRRVWQFKRLERDGARARACFTLQPLDDPVQRCRSALIWSARRQGWALVLGRRQVCGAMGLTPRRECAWKLAFFRRTVQGMKTVQPELGSIVCKAPPRHLLWRPRRSLVTSRCVATHKAHDIHWPWWRRRSSYSTPPAALGSMRLQLRSDRAGCLR